ncbi:MAG: 16S rRNA (cytosine(1402)-N(4))-methyltransferase RsmH [Pseudomonadota bacterium]
MVSEYSHLPVLKDEALESLRISREGIYVDGTFGRGGHSRALLDQLGDQGRLLAFDADPAAVLHARAHFATDPRFAIYHRNFDCLGQVCEEQRVAGQVDGVLLDLGVSSPQLDDPARGFSFSQDGPLDMRMDQDSGESARQWLARASEAELADVFYEYGEERYSRRIARALVQARQTQSFERTVELAAAVAAAHPRWEKHKHPATRVFQAIRIHINREMDALKGALAAMAQVLKVGGRLVVISFHSLEDRIVKRFARGDAARQSVPRGLPLPAGEVEWPMRAVGRAIRPSEFELERNQRARSAVMRVVERIA